jgi:flagellar hook protein FlgE
VDRVEFTAEGVLYAVYQNGARVAEYNIPLANVPGVDNLKPLPGDIFATSYNSGDILIGTPGNGGFGTLEGGALEQSTVDLAAELSDLIEAERHYQMNSKVFQTGADILDVIVNLKR